MEERLDFNIGHLLQESYIFIFLRPKQKQRPNMLNCNHASAYTIPFSTYLVK